MNKHIVFGKIAKKKTNQLSSKNVQILAMSSMAALLTACGTAATPTSTPGTTTPTPTPGTTTPTPDPGTTTPTPSPGGGAAPAAATTGNVVELIAPSANVSTATPTEQTNATNPATDFDDTITTTKANLIQSKINGLNGEDTLTITDALGGVNFAFDAVGANGALIANIEHIILANGTNVLSGLNSAVKSLTGGTGADTVSTIHLGLSSTVKVALGAGDDTLIVTGVASVIEDTDFTLATGIENIVVDSTTSTTVTLGALANAAIVSAGGNLDFTSTALTTGGTISGSALTTAGVDYVITNTVDVGLAGTAALILSGGTVKDTFVITQDSTADDGDDATTTSITAGAGADTITYNLTAGGAGTDVLTVVMTNTDDVARTAENLTEASINDGELLTFGNGVDVITGFVSGTDKFDVNNAGNLNTIADGSDIQLAVIAATENYQIRGTFDAGAGTFTIAAAGADTAIAYDADGAADLSAASQNWAVFVGVTALVVGDIGQLSKPKIILRLATQVASLFFVWRLVLVKCRYKKPTQKL